MKKNVVVEPSDQPNPIDPLPKIQQPITASEILAKQNKLSIVKSWIAQHKPLAAGLGVLLVLAISGLTYALFSAPDSPIHIPGITSSESEDVQSDSSNQNGSDQSTNNGGSQSSSNNGGGTSGSPSTGSSGGSGGGTSTPPTQPGTTFSAPIGYLGGSLTVNARDGYAELGGTKFWDRAAAYGGGTIDKWAAGINPGNENAKYWTAFNNFHTRSQSVGPTKTFWLQLLGRFEKTDDQYYNDTVAVINEIKSRIPGVTIYVSAMNGYSQTGVCDLPAEAPPQMRRIASRIAADGKALAGPYIGDITNAQLDSGATQCHANASGRAVLGAPLLNFFK